MRVYLMSLTDEKYSYVFKYKGYPSDLLKSFTSSEKLIRINDYIINKERLKEIKDITFDKTNKIDEIAEIEFSASDVKISIDDMIIREQCDIDRIAKELCNKMKESIKWGQ